MQELEAWLHFSSNGASSKFRMHFKLIMKSREILKVLISHILSLYQLFANFFIKRFVWNWLSDPDRIEFRGQIFSLIFSSMRNFYISSTMSLFFWTIIKCAANSIWLILILLKKLFLKKYLKGLKLL